MITSQGEPSPYQRAGSLATEMSQLAGHLNAGTHRLLELIGRFDRLGGHAYMNARSTAHFLSWQCGIGMRSAREHVRVSRALEKLPRIANALRKGEISYSKVRAITRVATEVDEDFFLNIAKSGTATHVERMAQLSRKYATPEEDRKAAFRQYANRSIRYRRSEDGSYIFEARLPPEQGALVLKALQAALDALYTDAISESDVFPKSKEAVYPVEQSGPAGPPARQPKGRTKGVDKVDALTSIAESFLANGPAALKGGERYQVFVHVDADALGSRCNLGDEVPLSRTTAQRIACDCATVCVHEDADGHVLDIGRRSRQIPSAIRRALELRDQGCRFPGCTNRRYVDGHHIQHWADGGETSLRNLVLLCRLHHRAVHEGGWTVEATDDGHMLFADASGRLWPAVPPPPRLPKDPVAALARTHEEQGLRITADTINPSWTGLPVDYGLGMYVLGNLRMRARLNAATPVPEPPSRE